jgi:hypothetical protein
LPSQDDRSHQDSGQEYKVLLAQFKTLSEEHKTLKLRLREMEQLCQKKSERDKWKVEDWNGVLEQFLKASASLQAQWSKILESAPSSRDLENVSVPQTDAYCEKGPR